MPATSMLPPAIISWIPRIPFSVLMLQTAIDVAKHHGHVYMVSLVGGLAATAFAVWYSITLVAVYVKYQPGNNNPSCASGGCSTASGRQPTGTGLVLLAAA